jgi:hypothetical protein
MPPKAGRSVGWSSTVQYPGIPIGIGIPVSFFNFCACTLYAVCVLWVSWVCVRAVETQTDSFEFVFPTGGLCIKWSRCRRYGTVHHIHEQLG